MFSWSRGRQLLYIFLFLSLCALIAATIYFIYKPTPTCFDKKQNQDEVGVDCGGVCTVLCRDKVFPIQVAWTRILPVRAGQYDMVAMLINNNAKAGLTDVFYTIKYFNERSFPIKEESGRTAIAPGEKFVLFRGGLVSDKQQIASAALLVASSSAWVRSENYLPQTSIRTEEFKNDATPILRANITNGTLKDINRLYLTAVLSDENGNVMGGSATYLDRLARGASAEIFFTWTKPFAKIPTSIEIYPHLDTFTP